MVNKVFHSIQYLTESMDVFCKYQVHFIKELFAYFYTVDKSKSANQIVNTQQIHMGLLPDED